MLRAWRTTSEHRESSSWTAGYFAAGFRVGKVQQVRRKSDKAAHFCGHVFELRACIGVE